MGEHDDLRGRAALVTGAGRRVGAAIARALGAEGMRVGVHYRASAEGAKATCAAVREAGGEAVALRADLCDRRAARDLVDETIECLGDLSVLVPSAASFERVPIDEVDDEAWDRTMALNLEVPFAMAHRARASLARERGSIVFITCTSATAPYRSYLPYVVSKGAVRQLMRALSLELAPEVRVNAVAPGTVLPPEDMDGRTLERLRARIPLGRFGEPEDVARAVVDLARSPYITGQELVVDGGATVAG